MKECNVKLYEGVNLEKVREVLRYYSDYEGKISIITTMKVNKLHLTLKAYENVESETAYNLIKNIFVRLKICQLVEEHNFL
ncbi:hypothetical protein [Acinetobacter baumannii]|uniref:hypothetical protein n=1 Tax=Acinetobacter baumannii TaxID=470 RepID=UPI0004A63438|nr:hypothetical protein [Acinetobacter baumannii]MDC4592334.1 hypothetical protein [Acinetobacter baumannii]MDC4632960.1 hypothetical protein [Acinetobacter baumannii]MDC5191728.1 hypothetical protein [Acinetobacter baumannii]MDV7449635.1 hypothetical protein [Acinetobacter baumannii]RUT37723.1 hypothetical protein EM030_17575 [Acinetobacter baumannii]